MTDAADATDREETGRAPSGLLAPIRLGVGLLQGLALWWLHWTSDGVTGWPWRPETFLPLLLIFAFVPVLLLAGVGRMRRTTLAAWIAVATALLALMGWHEVARQSADALHGPPYIRGPMPLFAVVALFIGHHLVLAADMTHRWVAPFPVYFDTVWKAAVQLALSIGFTGAFWVLLFLGSALFRIIGLDFLETLTRESWFFVPVTTLAFALAVHLTDVRDGLIRGVRTVGLMLLSWLLLVMTVLAAGFVLALPFTGLKGLWDTGSATSLVLAAAAAMIVLINAAYQDGRPENRPPLPLRLAVQVASLLLVPLVVIAFWGLALRIGQHGLTPERIIALACALVGAVFAGGYALASVRAFLGRDRWMRLLEPTTLAGAALAFLLILALFSPVLDPARLSVADQVARLERGAVTPERFDYAFLRWESGKAGRAALARLQRSSNPDIARRARDAAATARGDQGEPAAPRIMPVFETYPAGGSLPAGFSGAVPQTDGRAVCSSTAACLASPMDLDGDGRLEVLLVHRFYARVWAQGADGAWRDIGGYGFRGCGPDNGDLREDVRAGRLRLVEPAWNDVIVADGRRSAFQPADPECRPARSGEVDQTPIIESDERP